MSFCQYDPTNRLEKHDGQFIAEFQCAFCHRKVWLRDPSKMPYDWCEVRPDKHPYSSCARRGEQIGHQPDKLCGDCKGKMLPIFQCGVHETCSFKPLQHNQKMMSCLRCFTDGLGFEKPKD